MRTAIIIYYSLLVFWILVSCLPVGKSLVSVHRSGFGLNLCAHASPDLWWLFTLYYNGWGIEIYYSLNPYWSITSGYTRSAGIRLWRISWLVYLGRLGREVLVRNPPKNG